MRDKKLIIKITDEDKQFLQKASNKLSLNLGSFCRMASKEKALKILNTNSEKN